MAEHETSILKMDTRRARWWCEQHWQKLNSLWMRELLFRDEQRKQISFHIEGLAGFRDRHSIIHAQRAEALVGEVEITNALLYLLHKLGLTLDGKEQNPFPNELAPDEARAWLAETRVKLMAKIRHEKAYLKKCLDRHIQPHKDAATEQDIAVEQEVLGLLDELLETFPPLRLSRPKLRAQSVRSSMLGSD